MFGDKWNDMTRYFPKCIVQAQLALECAVKSDDYSWILEMETFGDEELSPNLQAHTGTKTFPEQKYTHGWWESMLAVLYHCLMFRADILFVEFVSNDGEVREPVTPVRKDIADGLNSKATATYVNTEGKAREIAPLPVRPIPLQEPDKPDSLDADDSDVEVISNGEHLYPPPIPALSHSSNHSSTSTAAKVEGRCGIDAKKTW